MTWWALPALAAAAYYLLAMAAALRWRRAGWRPAGGARPPQAVSILKPVHGRDPGFYQAIQSHAVQEFPQFEILFGVSDPQDAAIPDIERLRREYPSVPIALHVVSTNAANTKVGVLAELAQRARYPVLLLNDSDIKVEPGYLRDVTLPLADHATGLVTCIYRAAAESWPSRMEALGIATEFAPSVLVARLLGVAEFALGSTMAFRADTLREVGGFLPIADYLADDYQLGSRIHARGYHIRFARAVVETNLGAQDWGSTWRHQLRWSRTIRVSRFSGYCGYGVTHATVWALVAFAAGQWIAGAAALACRVGAGVWVAGGVLGDWPSVRCWWLIPLRDLFGFAVWFAGLFGMSVQWRRHRLRLQSDGKICKVSNRT